jgi:hypothetical protein
MGREGRGLWFLGMSIESLMWIHRLSHSACMDLDKVLEKPLGLKHPLVCTPRRLPPRKGVLSLKLLLHRPSHLVPHRVLLPSSPPLALICLLRRYLVQRLRLVGIDLCLSFRRRPWNICRRDSCRLLLLISSRLLCVLAYIPKRVLRQERFHKFADTGIIPLTFSKDGGFTCFKRGVGNCKDKLVAWFVSWC